MTITERTLKKWRREALKELGQIDKLGKDEPEYKFMVDMLNRMLKMTQELMDIHLIKRS